MLNLVEKKPKKLRNYGIKNLMTMNLQLNN